MQLDDAAFWNVDHVTVTYYPVGPEDYEGTSVSGLCYLHVGQASVATVLSRYSCCPEALRGDHGWC